MAVYRYTTQSGEAFFMVRTWLKERDGRLRQFVKRRIPTREQAKALEATRKREAFDGRYFPERHVTIKRVTVADAWKAYEPKAKRDNRAFKSADRCRSAHVLEHLGSRVVADLSLADIEAYRGLRLAQKTKRGGPPSSGTLDRELELLKRLLNYAAACGQIPQNPIASVKLLGRGNIRRVVVPEDAFERVLAKADPHLRPILLVAYTTGMRRGEILNLRWKGEVDASGLDLKAGVIRLAGSDTKTDEPRVVYLTSRASAALREVPRHLKSPYVFTNPETGKPWREVRKAWRRACKGAGLEGVWFHDLRRSFITIARRKGIAQSVVRRFSGHKTDAVFKRYDIVEEEDLKAAAKRLEVPGTVLVPDAPTAPHNAEGPAS
jgi:integrase